MIPWFVSFSLLFGLFRAFVSFHFTTLQINQTERETENKPEDRC